MIIRKIDTKVRGMSYPGRRLSSVVCRLSYCTPRAIMAWTIFSRAMQ